MSSTFIIVIAGMIFVAFSFWFIRKLLAPKNAFNEFFKGEGGKYSLSRFQAAVWAFVIISYQISTLIAVISLGRDHLTEFSLVFSEEAIWLLGLSLGSYITVKGIAVSQDTQTASTAVISARKSSKNIASLSDFVCSDEGLDLSRFQMLIWTLVAVVVFIVSYFVYIENILTAGQSGSVSEYFPLFSEQGSEGVKKLPTVDMSFIVLMGLSHGAYIGRKLVPSHKVDSFTREYIADLKLRKETMNTGLKFKEIEFQLIKDSPQVATDKKIELENELSQIRSQMTKLEDEITVLQKPVV